MSAGKGDTYRKVDGGKYRDNWGRIFDNAKADNVDEKYKQQYIVSLLSFECAVVDSKGNHCPDIPTHYIEEKSTGKQFYLCDKCYTNAYLNARINDLNKKGIDINDPDTIIGAKSISDAIDKAIIDKITKKEKE